MVRVLAVLCAVATAWSAETVTGLSAPFSFPTSTAGVQKAAQPAVPASLTCRASPDGVVSARWALDPGVLPGRIALVGLDGRVTGTWDVRRSAGAVALTGVAAGVYLATLSAGGITRTTRIAVDR